MSAFDFGAIALAHLLGAVPFGLVIGRALGGVDPRTAGSGNIGATNVARTAGPGWGILTFALDFAKGGAVPLALIVSGGGPSWLPAACGLAAILGHVFPVYLGFRGGKGVATAAGAFAVLAPIPLGIALVTFGLVLGLSRVVALGSMAAALALVVGVWGFGAVPSIGILAIAAAVLIFVRHAGNIRGLLAARPRESTDEHP